MGNRSDDECAEKYAVLCDLVAARYARMVELVLDSDPRAARRYAQYSAAAAQCAHEIRALEGDAEHA